jgi:hypothetical protein
VKPVHRLAHRHDERFTKLRGGGSPNSQSAHPPRSGFVRRISASRCLRWPRIRSGAAWTRISSDARAFAGLVGSVKVITQESLRDWSGRPTGARVGGEVATRSKSRVRFMVLPTGFEPAAGISLQHIWHVAVCPAGALVAPDGNTSLLRVMRGFGKCRCVAPRRPRGYCRSSCDKPGKTAVSARRSGVGLSHKFIEAIDLKLSRVPRYAWQKSSASIASTKA